MREKERFLPRKGKGREEWGESCALILGGVQDVTRPWREWLPGALREGGRRHRAHIPPP